MFTLYIDTDVLSLLVIGLTLMLKKGISYTS